mmetsp:Transcript_50583/g.161847  ORF Transcript_50583/g.161847 Transcript_50583/m.161847 type:complete len:211 (+) Transcript_50583:423-1055(+)
MAPDAEVRLASGPEGTSSAGCATPGLGASSSKHPESSSAASAASREAWDAALASNICRATKSSWALRPASAPPASSAPGMVATAAEISGGSWWWRSEALRCPRSRVHTRHAEASGGLRWKHRVHSHSTSSTPGDPPPTSRGVGRLRGGGGIFPRRAECCLTNAASSPATSAAIASTPLAPPRRGIAGSPNDHEAADSGREPAPSPCSHPG